MIDAALCLYDRLRRRYQPEKARRQDAKRLAGPISENRKMRYKLNLTTTGPGNDDAESSNDTGI